MKLAIAQSVLNVDDNEASLYAKSRILRHAGFEVFEAADGTTALRLVAERMPQLVLLDVRLPDISGLEVCRRIKSNPATQRIPVLHISATHVTEEDQRAGLVGGADVYLVEPITPEELITVVRTLMRLRLTEYGLSASEERLRLATESAGLGTWDIDLRTGRSVWSPHLYRMLGLAQGDGNANIKDWTDRIHPDDLDATMRAFAESQHANVRFSHEHRIVRADDGSERWLAPNGMFHLDETGRRTRFIGVMLDVTDRRRFDAERNALLKRESAARLDAEEAARLKDQFLATLSHELRTPMSAVLGWLHLLRSGKLRKDQEQQALETIERNARLQNQLINDLLDVSRSITGQLRIERVKAHPVAVLRAAIESVRPQASGRQVSIAVDVPDEDPVVWGDPSRLQQVFNNLLVNAIKFSHAGGRIDVTMRNTAETIDIAFRDYGEGIAPDMLPFIFERFRQADGSLTRKHGGMGLGLAIARHLLDLHAGSITAESEGPGMGATFTVTLPRLDQRVEAAAAPIARRPSPAPVDEHPLAGIKLLVVDDDPNALGMLSLMLELAGASVYTATSAHDAIISFHEHRDIAVILSDIGMPGRDGYDLVETLRREAPAERARVPAIAITGYARDEDQARAMRSGFDAHLAKPFGEDALLALITSLVRKRVDDTAAGGQAA
jgi:PAS domain S-box-containing protein